MIKCCVGFLLQPTARSTARGTRRIFTSSSKLLAEYDANKDGTISAAESLSVFQAEVDKRIADILTEFDTNKDGSVTRAEVNAVLTADRGKGAPPAAGTGTGGQGAGTGAPIPPPQAPAGQKPGGGGPHH